MQRGQRKEEMEKITEMLQKLDNGQKEMKNYFSQEMMAMKEDIKKEIAGLKTELKEVKDMSEENRKRVEDLEKGWKGAQGGQKNLECVVLNLQLEKSMLFLRFQNVPEEEGENLKDKMSEMLAEFTGMELERVKWDIDQVYRVNSRYAIIHNVPREIHVKFLRMETRDEVLRAQRGGSLEHGGKEILILKQIPRKIREMRKKYFFLATKLYQKGVMFRWTVPEGMIISWEGRRIKIDTIKQAQAFLKEHLALPEGGEVQEEERGQEQVSEESGAVGMDLGAEGGTEPSALPRLRPKKDKKHKKTLI